MKKLIKIDAEWLARCFHDYYEDTAKLKGWETNKKCQVEFDDLPKENRETMICTASKVAMEIEGKVALENMNFPSIKREKYKKMMARE